MSERLYREIEYLLNFDPGGRNNRSLQRTNESAEPASYRAARLLHDLVSEGDAVFIATGFPILSAESPETDGPPGALALAEAVASLGGEPVFCVDSLTEPVMERLRSAGELSASIRSLSVERERAREQAGALLDEYRPSLCIAVERPGRCRDGTYRNMAGEDVSHLAGKVDELFAVADARGVSTVGIGDGGNEIGMGTVTDAVDAHVPRGERVAATTETDVLVTAGVSNWGAYGVVAALSRFDDDVTLHDGATERARIAACVEAGTVDGISGESTESVDGLPASVHANFVELLAGTADV